MYSISRLTRDTSDKTHPIISTVFCRFNGVKREEGVIFGTFFHKKKMRFVLREVRYFRNIHHNVSLLCPQRH
jgi:hypothetical protein